VLSVNAGRGVHSSTPEIDIQRLLYSVSEFEFVGPTYFLLNLSDASASEILWTIHVRSCSKLTSTHD
jgi:hypothetical protein